MLRVLRIQTPKTGVRRQNVGSAGVGTPNSAHSDKFTGFRSRGVRLRSKLGAGVNGVRLDALLREAEARSALRTHLASIKASVAAIEKLLEEDGGGRPSSSAP